MSINKEIKLSQLRWARIAYSYLIGQVYERHFKRMTAGIIGFISEREKVMKEYNKDEKTKSK